MKKKRSAFLPLLLIVVFLLASCTPTKESPELPPESNVTIKIKDDITDRALTDINTTTSTKNYQEEKLLNFGQEESILYLSENNGEITVLMKNGENRSVKTSTDGKTWDTKDLSSNAETKLDAKYSGEIYEIEAVLTPDGTYYSYRHVFDSPNSMVQDKNLLLRLKPGADEYEYYDIANFIDVKKGNLFFINPLVSPTANRLFINYSTMDSEDYSETAGVIVIDTQNMSLLTHVETEEPFSSFFENFQFVYGQISNSPVAFEVYDVNSGTKIDDNISTNYSSQNSGVNAFYADEKGDIYWITEEGIFHLTSGGSVVEQVVTSENFAFENPVVILGFKRTSDGKFLANIAESNDGKMNNLGLYQYAY